MERGAGRRAFLYNNPSSVDFLGQEDRSNCLLLYDRKQHISEDAICLLYKQENQTINHLIISCPAYGAQRMHSIYLQRSHNGNEDEIIGRFLFHKDHIDKKKKVL